jgi:SET domain-containing protein
MHVAMPKTKSRTAPRREAPSRSSWRLRRSRIHGTGVFATRAIPKGARVIEYVGERITHAEADRRCAHTAPDNNHTFLFTLDSKIVVDAGVGGNAARFINHSCDPNCEASIEDGRIFIDAVRTIAPGEELAYDYNIGRAPDDPPNVEQIFACRCGAATCRGTMIAPLEEEEEEEEPTKSPARPARGRKTKTKASGRALPARRSSRG